MVVEALQLKVLGLRGSNMPPMMQIPVYTNYTLRITHMYTPEINHDLLAAERRAALSIHVMKYFGPSPP